MNLRQRLASQSSIIFSARILGAGIIFLAQIAIARIWGAHQLGEYMIIMAVVNLIAVFLPLGFQTIGTYFTSEYRAKKDKKTLKKFLFHAYGHIIIMALIIGFVILPLIINFTQIGQKIAPYSTSIIFISCASAIIYVNGAILVGLKRPFAAYFTDALFRPLMVIGSLSIISAIFFEQNFIALLLKFLAFGFMSIAILQFFYVYNSVKKMPSHKSEQKNEQMRWWRFAFAWVLIALATDFFFDIDLIILANFLEPHDLAIFGVSARIFTLAAFGISAIYAVCLPDIFESEVNNDRLGFLQKVGEANFVAAALSFILLIAISLLGYFVLGIFGEDFTKGLWPLIILCSALLARSIFGPASLVLSIYNRPYASLPAVFIGLFSLLILNYLLVPPFGLIGAAMAALSAILIWSIMQWLVTKKIAKVDISIFEYLKNNFSIFAKP